MSITELAAAVEGAEPVELPSNGAERKRLRRAAGITQQEAGTAMDKSVSAVRRWELGQSPSFTTVRVYGAFLAVCQQISEGR
jgi:DNA-binding transcriptional regulator YiaG